MSTKTVSAESIRALLPKVQGPIVTVLQFEERHPGTSGRMRGYIMRADLGLPDYTGLSDAVIRIGRTVMLDEAAALKWLQSRLHQPKSRARNPHGRAGKRGGC